MKPVLDIHAKVFGPDENIECTIHSEGTFEEVKAALIQLRDHLDERIKSEHECPASPKFTGFGEKCPRNFGESIRVPWRPPCGVDSSDKDDVA